MKSKITLSLLMLLVALAGAARASGQTYAAMSFSGAVFYFDPNFSITVAARSGENDQGVAVDRNGNVYVSNFSSNTITKYDPSGQGTIFSSSTLLQRPLGLAFDSNGNLFVANNGGNISGDFTSTIVKLDSSGNATLFATEDAFGGLGYGARSIAFDRNGNLFVANFSGSIVKFNAAGQGTVFAYQPHGVWGIAVDNGGNVYAVDHTDDIFLTPFIVKYDAITAAPVLFATTGLGAHSFGMTFDGVGNLYVVDGGDIFSFDGAAFVEKYSPTGTDQGRVVTIRALAFSIAFAPANTTPLVLSLPANQTLEAASAAGSVVNFSATATGTGTVSVTYSQPPGTIFPLGTTTVIVSASDSAGSKATGSFTVTVRDTTPPVITSLSSSLTTLWPVNHKMSPITLRVTTADAVSAVTTRIISVTSNEPINGVGDGNTTPDWEITGVMTLKLRAERTGTSNGRIYSVMVEAMDAAGNKSTRIALVTVPKSL